MESNRDLVSVVVPMHNAEDYICATLASILDESEIPIEVIVVNDKSTDASLNRVLKFSDQRIRVLEGPGRGAPAAMNTGFAEARGAVLMHCDADDLYSRRRIHQQVAWLNANREHVAVCGSFAAIDSSGRLISELQCGAQPLEITAELREGIVRTSLCTYAIRAETMIKVGGFREYFESAYDIDLQLRLSELGRIGYIPENFYYWRIHAASLTHTQDNVLREFFERTAHDFQKQRRASGLDDLQRGHPPSMPEQRLSPANSASAHIQGLLLGRAWREHGAGQKAKALTTGLRALAETPTNYDAWKSLLALALKPAGGRKT